MVKTEGDEQRQREKTRRRERKRERKERKREILAKRVWENGGKQEV